MARLACVRVAHLALQILRQREQVEQGPMVVIDRDRPTGRVLELNAAAAALGIFRGLRYSQVLALAADVCAGTVDRATRSQALAQIETQLRRCSPAVERCSYEDGVFFVDIRGLERLYTTFSAWCAAVHQVLPDWELQIVHGWSRAALLVASLRAPSRPLPNERAERNWLRRQALAALPLPGRDAQKLSLLGVDRIGAFVDLPKPHVARRFAKQTVALYELVACIDELPVQGQPPPEVPQIGREYQPAIKRNDTLARAIAALLPPLMQTLRGTVQWVHALDIQLCDENGALHRELIQVGNVNRDPLLWRRLIELRFASFAAPPIERVTIAPLVRQAQGVQLPLDLSVHDASQPRVDALALDRCIGLLQAEFGAAAVYRLAVRSGWVPEQRFERVPVTGWSDLRAGTELPPADGRSIVRIRRLGVQHDRDATPWPSRSGAERERIWGPFLVSAQWWTDQPVERAYYYRSESDGALRWYYRTAVSVQVQGSVE